MYGERGLHALRHPDDLVRSGRGARRARQDQPAGPGSGV